MADNPQTSPQTLSEDKTQKLIHILFAAFFILWLALGLVIGTPSAAFAGLKTIIFSRAPLITDYIALAGFSGAFLNSALVFLLNIVLIRIFKAQVNGALLAGMYISAGFALFGKNIITILPIYFGVFLYSKYVVQKPFENYLSAAFFTTSLCPLVSEMPSFFKDYPPYAGITAAILVGIFAGFVVPALARWTAHAHQAYDLYNYGFAAGLFSTVVVAVFNSFGHVVKSELIWNTEKQTELLIFLIVFFLLHIAAGILLDHKNLFTRLKNITFASGRAQDFLKIHGLPTTLVNMGIVGLLGTFAILFTGGDFSGPTVGCIITIAGFGAIGLNLRNTGYIMLGVLIGSYLKVWEITAPGMQLCLLLCSGLAPVAGDLGIIPGIFAGFLHSSVTRNAGSLSSPLNLYNNGFSIGILAIFLVPIIKELRRTPLPIAPQKSED